MMYDDIRAFQAKLQLCERQMRTQRYDHFMMLKSLGHVSEESCVAFSDLLRDLQKEFEDRFRDISSLSKKFQLSPLPFSVRADDVALELQVALLKPQGNTTLRQTFEDVGMPHFYRFLDEAIFSALRSQAAKITGMLGRTYWCEQLFSLIKVNRSTLRSRITDEHLRSTMKIVSAQEQVAGIPSLVAAKRRHVSSQRAAGLPWLLCSCYISFDDNLANRAEAGRGRDENFVSEKGKNRRLRKGTRRWRRFSR